MAWFWKPVQRDTTTPPGGTLRQFRSKAVAPGPGSKQKRGTVFATPWRKPRNQ